MYDNFILVQYQVHDTKPTTNWMTIPSHTAMVHKSPAYLMNETLFHYQISALQYKWVDLPQVREFWLRKQLPDEIAIWKTSQQKEDVNKTREERHIRMARKQQIEAAYHKMMVQRQQRLQSLEEATTSRTKAHVEKHVRFINKKQVAKEHQTRMYRKKQRLRLAEEAKAAQGKTSFFGRIKKKH